MVGREASSSMKSLVWVMGEFSISTSAPCWHLNTFHRPGEAAEQLWEHRAGLLSQTCLSLAYSCFCILIPPAESRCPDCRDAINHYGDCCNPPSLGSGAQLSTQQQVLGGFLEGAFFYAGVQCLKAEGGFSLPANRGCAGGTSRGRRVPVTRTRSLSLVEVVGVEGCLSEEWLHSEF